MEDKKVKKSSKDKTSELISSIAKELVKEFKHNKLIRQDIGYFRKVELLLINYNNLKSAITQKKEDIEYIERYGLPEKSKSVVVYSSSSGNVSVQERYNMLIEKYKADCVETEREINKIDNALMKIRNDKYFKVLEYKYLNEEKLTEEQIAEIMEKDQSTINRNRVRLINILKVILFPESIQEL